MHEVIGECSVSRWDWGLNKVVMMTVHDHIEGSFGAGPITGVRSSRWGIWERGERSGRGVDYSLWSLDRLN